MIPVELDKTRNLHFGLSGVRDLERALGGKPLGDVIRDLSRLGVDTLVISLYHGLKHEDKGLNPNLVLKMLEEHLERGEGLQTIYDAVSEALEGTGVFRTREDVEAGKHKTPTPA